MGAGQADRQVRRKGKITRPSSMALARSRKMPAAAISNTALQDGDSVERLVLIKLVHAQ